MLGHLETLGGSEHAKTRMTVFLKTLQGELTVVEACQILHIEETRFHAARKEWLVESVQLLEPRRMGRPVKTNVETPEEVERLRVENQELRHRLRAMEVSLDVAMILSSESTATGKKTTEGALSQRLPR
jgi:hypothetical protein